MANIEKLRENLAILDGKIAVLHERREVMCARLKEAEDLDILRMIDAVKLDHRGIKELLEDLANGKLVRRDDAEGIDRYEA